VRGDVMSDDQLVQIGWARATAFQEKKRGRLACRALLSREVLLSGALSQGHEPAAHLFRRLLRRRCGGRLKILLRMTHPRVAKLPDGQRKLQISSPATMGRGGYSNRRKSYSAGEAAISLSRVKTGEGLPFLLFANLAGNNCQLKGLKLVYSRSA